MWQADHQYRQQFLLSMPAQLAKDKFTKDRQNYYQQQHPQAAPLSRQVELVNENNHIFHPPQPPQQLQNNAKMEIANCYSSNPRASRNMAEKQRRDNLNTQIATMATLVPSVSTGGSRKKDKISILRLTAAHLRIAYTVGQTSQEFLPRQFNDIDLENSLIDNLAGNASFLIIVTTSGKIVYISRHIEQHLGHEQMDLIGESWYNYVYSEDHDELTRGLTPDESCLGTEPGSALRNSGDSLEDTSNSSDDSGQTRLEYANFREQRRSFVIRMAQRTNSRREAVHYEFLQVSGMIRLASECRNRAVNRPKREYHSTSNDIIFVGTARLLMKRTIPELRLLEPNKNEYFTRHLIDGRILFCDHRISIIAGYMSEEVSGTSAFKFMHKEDVKWTAVALKQMIIHGQYGSSCYRLMTKTGQYIYLRTDGYLEYEEATQIPMSFTCINTLTEPEEGEELIAEMKTRFSASAAAEGSEEFLAFDAMCSNNGLENSEEQPTIDEVILDVLSDLSPLVTSEDRQSASPLPNTQLVKAAMYAQRLPPVSLQASRIGIKDQNAWIHAGKGGKGKGKGKGGKGGKGNSPSEADESQPSSSNSESNTRGKQIAEKRIPELEESPSPVAEKAVSPSNSVETELYSKPNVFDNRFEVSRVSVTNVVASTRTVHASTSFTLQSDSSDVQQPQIHPGNVPYQMNLKRSYVTRDETLYISPSKKKAVENCVILDVTDQTNSVPCENRGFADYPGYMQVQPAALESNVHKEHADFQQFDNNPIPHTDSANQYVDFQNIKEEQLLSNAIESNPALLKILTDLPPTIAVEGIPENVNGHEYLPSDQDSLDKNRVGHVHLQAADSMSSGESQLSDAIEANIQVQCKKENQEHSIQG